jgi:uncharacterized protein (DUF1501 family)
MAKTNGWTRRDFLEICGTGLSAIALRSVLFPAEALAAAPNPNKYFLFCYFSGGWDQLMALDPRDQTLPQFQQAAAYAATGSGIYPAYDLLTDPTTKALLASNPSGVQSVSGSPITFGPAVPASFLAHAQDVCVIRGINMGTLTHEVGRRYFITGKFPRGLQASGSALPTAIAGQEGDASDVPNLSVGVESYNDAFPSYASGIQVTSASDVQNMLRLIGTPLPAASSAAVQQFESSADSCQDHGLNGGGLIDLFRESRIKARDIVASGESSHFAFTLDPTKQSAEIASLFQAFNIQTAQDLAGPKGQAALAAQAFTKGISQAVSLTPAVGIDSHFGEEWTRTHAPALRSGFDALALLISYLKNTPDPTSGDSYWAHTSLMCFSEFSRTPLVNSRGGRDHHLAGSCLLAGPGIKSNIVIGATSDAGMYTRNMDLSTGLPNDTTGFTVRPADVHATVLQSMGLTYSNLMNQSPQLIQAVLK